MSYSEWIIDRTGGRTMIYLTCIMISSVDLACYEFLVLKIWVSVDNGFMFWYSGKSGLVMVQKVAVRL